MLKHIKHTKLGRSQRGWLDSHFHFSFAEYYNPDNIQFGVLRVLNDDIVLPGTGFTPHSHENMEVISYVVRGELSHKDSMGNMHTLTRGQAQYMSAGTGVTHSEMNDGTDVLRFLQMWILPDKTGHAPNYGEYRFEWKDRFNKWLPIATGYQNTENSAPIKIHADANVYAAVLSADESLDFVVAENRQAYLLVIEGEATVEGIKLVERDAMEIVEQNVTITTGDYAHLYMIEMAHDKK